MSDVNATDIPENATYPLKNASYREAIPLTEKRLAVPVTEAFPESPPICRKTGQKITLIAVFCLLSGIRYVIIKETIQL